MWQADRARLEDDLVRLESIVVGLRTHLAQRDTLRLPVDQEGPSFASYAQSILSSRKKLHRFLPGRYFNDPAYDMLLELFVATATRELRSFKETALASRVPPATAARYVEMMVRDGLIVREADQHDGRRTLLSLSDAAMEALRNWLNAISPTALQPDARD